MKNKSNFRPSGSKNRPPARGPQGPRSSAPGALRSRDPEIPKSWRIIPGFHAIHEALRVRPQGVRLLWLRQGWEHSQELKELQHQVLAAKGKVEVKPVAVLDRICATHQGAVLYVEGGPELSLSGLENFEKSVLVYLDGIEDPHNLGAILRTSWLVGAHGLFIPEDRAVGLTPTAHKVACGGAEHVPVEEVNNFTNYAEDLKKMGYWVFGLSHKSKKTLFDIEIPDKIVWAVGAEDKGLRGTTERLCDELVSIPQISAAASYNASVATAMALTESLRKHTTQHTNRKKSPTA
jgi:23S rRNA (guanosine2251-2'-O)-methyltransferase